jgi:hypothetical protein
MFLRNVGCNLTDYTASHPRRRYSSKYGILITCYLPHVTPSLLGPNILSTLFSNILNEYPSLNVKDPYRTTDTFIVCVF